MANIINRQQTFSTNGTVTAAGLHNLIDTALVNSAIIKNQQEITTIGTADLLLIAPDSVDASLAPRKVTVQNLLDDGLTAGTFTTLNLTGALTYGTATGDRTVSTSATITTGTIPNLTAGTTTSTAATITNGTITTGLIPTLTAGTTTGTAGIFTSGTVATLNSTTGTIATLVASAGTFAGSLVNVTTGTVATLNSTTGTIATLNSTTGTIPTLVATTLITTGTGTGEAPAIAPTGDTNTGIFFPAADTLAATTNGTERLRIASDGQIGIGGANYGTSGQVLTSGGSAAAPSWQTAAGITSGTAVATTTGTAIDFTGIPSGVKRITVMFNGVSVNTGAEYLIQIGSTTFSTTGYNSISNETNQANATSGVSSTAGFAVKGGNAAELISGIMTIVNISSNTWISSHTGRKSNTNASFGAGNGSVSGTLDRVRVTATTLSTFDAGSINILYES
jgi:hypothetical protein